MGYALLGALSLLCGWLCFNHARTRRSLSHGDSNLSRYAIPRPLMLVSLLLAALFGLLGIAFFILAVLEQFG